MPSSVLKARTFNLIGVDYQRERTNGGHKRQTLEDTETLVRPDMLNILLSHNPNSFPRAADWVSSSRLPATPTAARSRWKFSITV